MNATYADCAVIVGVVVEAEEADASLFAALEDRVALDKMPPFFGLPEAAAAAAVEGALQYGLSAARPIVSATSRSSCVGLSSSRNLHSKIEVVSPPPMSASSSSSSWKVM